jgi:hypothetical protein
VEVDVVTLASEFPNDNPALHRGVSWVCLDVTGAPVAVCETVEADEAVEAVETVADESVSRSAEVLPVPAPRISGVVPVGQYVHDDEDDDDPIVVEELPPLGETASVEGDLEPLGLPDSERVEVAAASAPTSLPPAPDDPFTILLTMLADVAIGAGSPHVASVLPGLLVDGRLDHAMPPDATQALAEADVVRGTGATPAFVAQTHAWQAILRGTSDDFSACGNAMLDEWAAELLARLLGAPSRATSLRRELRSRGVAAFGLVEAA